MYIVNIVLYHSSVGDSGGARAGLGDLGHGSHQDSDIIMMTMTTLIMTIPILLLLLLLLTIIVILLLMIMMILMLMNILIILLLPPGLRQRGLLCVGPRHTYDITCVHIYTYIHTHTCICTRYIRCAVNCTQHTYDIRVYAYMYTYNITHICIYLHSVYSVYIVYSVRSHFGSSPKPFRLERMSEQVSLR